MSRIRQWTLLLSAMLVALGQLNAFSQSTDDRQQRAGDREQEIKRRWRDNGRSRRNSGPGQSGLQIGEMAPTFKLKSLDGQSETDLASFHDQKPVVLFFGSYT